MYLSHLSNRQKRVHVGEKCSSWQTTSKGVTQRYVLGPLFFNVFINNLFYFKTVLFTIYADNNTLPYSNKSFKIVKLYLEREAEKFIWWFAISCMKATLSYQ